MHSILLVDDEEPMRELLKVQLIGAGYEVDEAKDGQEALKKMTNNPRYSVLVLDWMMPFMDGVELTRRIREFSSVPIIMLTARDETEDKVKSLSGGADDYVTKPFENAELLARIQAVIRRMSNSNQVNGQALMYNGLSLDPEERKIWYEGQGASLTQHEYDMILLFFKHPKQVFSRLQFIELVWGSEFVGDERTVDSHIRNLRNKLKSIGATEFIKTVWGVGYQFV